MLNRTRRALVAAVAATAVVGIGAGTVPAQAAPPTAQTSASRSTDIVDQLRAIPGLKIVSESATPPPGYRFFLLTYTQPVDHRKPNGATFEQRFQLLHKDTARPMVLHTTGYNMPANAFRSEPTRLVDGNQISVEQRFFSPSRPAPANWDDLTIWQAATDHHRLVTALKPVYSAKWVSTGASKGGMTSVYHRRFYPDDVNGVVAYVAPNDRVNPEDHAYDRFFATVGTDPACRTRLENVQREALKRRPEMVAKYQTLADKNGWTFTGVLGTIDRAYEQTVLDTAWGFWQYSTQADCVKVPEAAAVTTDALFAFIDDIAGFSFYSDQGILPYAPYYFQAATQLGWPKPRFDHLRGLTRYPNLYDVNNNLPPELRRRHDPRPMLDVDHWVRKDASRMLFVYGGNDPWGSEPFSPSTKDSYRYLAPGANHGANIAGLVPDENAAATATLRRWAGVEAPVVMNGVTVESADDGITALDLAEPRNLRQPL